MNLPLVRHRETAFGRCLRPDVCRALPLLWGGLVFSFGLICVHGFEWQEQSGFRSAPLQVNPHGKVGFTLMDPSLTGVYYTNVLARSRYLTNQIYLNGSGVTAGDVDGDERVDVFFAGLDGKNRLYRNLGGWRFEDITDSAGVGAEPLACSGCVLVDVEGDRDLDLLVNTIGQGTHLFTNDGQGKFTWQTRRRAPNAGRGGMSMALGDVDGDGDLDLYLANYRTWTYRDHPRPKIRGKHINGKPVVVSFNGRPTTEPDLVGRFSLTKQNKIIENGELDAFFLNDGSGRFKQVAFNGGNFLDVSGEVWKERPFDWGLSVMFRDMNGDLAPDLYVCNDFSAPDRIWLNQGGGVFQMMTALALRNTSRFSMGIDFADVDRDGNDDFVVMDMLSRSPERRLVQMGEPPLNRERGDDLHQRPQFSRNTMYRSRGDGTYAEVAYWAGTQAAEWAWTPVFLDVDLDGYEDLLVTNGHERDVLNADVRAQIERQVQDPKLTRNGILLLSNLYARLATPNVVFRNRGDFSFEDVSEAWGFDTPAVSHGMALADLDGDGDQDVLVNNLNSLAGVFLNGGAGSRVAVRLRGRPPNTSGIGAKIRFQGQPMSQSQEVISGGRYLSGDDSLRVFACAASETEAVIEVVWRSGKVTRVKGVQANHLYEIFEAEAESNEASEPNETPPLFMDVSSLLSHAHRETPFDDFFRQRLLSRGLSELGPGIGWADIDGDSDDDLLVGCGRGGRMGVLINDSGKAFKAVSSQRFNPLQSRDQTGIAAWQTEAGGAVFAHGSANYEDGSPTGAAVRIVAFGTDAKPRQLAAGVSSVGPLAASDFDGDGDLDLFVGGRVIPGQYPLAADSQLWINTEGVLAPSPLNDSLLRQVGLVSGAVWSDLRGDGFPELILACEWGPVRILENREGILSDGTALWGMSDQTGWWHGVNAGDFNGDGRMDLVVSNWGWNHVYHPLGAENLRWFSGRVANAGPTLLIEGYVDRDHPQPIPIRSFGVYAASVPGIRERFRTFGRFSTQTISSILGVEFPKYQRHLVKTFAHTLFLNQGSRFKAKPLPWLCQLAPGFALPIADVNADGAEDLFLSQNLFHLRPEMSRLDAGRGLLLLGDGKGGFDVVEGEASGIEVYGEQRGAAFGDYDSDGRVDLAVSQNGAATKLYRNERAQQGIRIRLNAGAQNVTGIGASIRLGDESTFGPVREIHAGSGYWSQDSAVQVMRSDRSHIKVRWPGGDATVSKIPASAAEISVDRSGKVRKLR
ncbi:MAG: hypothetical protein M2R45_02502 [Verrucomicrobia subdivision 3 bacterium]|nr:hypothetical protein [Limisphaerales bacterium]MCS1413292.1 hypothetical protein [Limisphaerales bacterium]